MVKVGTELTHSASIVVTYLGSQMRKIGEKKRLDCSSSLYTISPVLDGDNECIVQKM